jgi:hypothetical protein
VRILKKRYWRQIINARLIENPIIFEKMYHDGWGMELVVEGRCLWLLADILAQLCRFIVGLG